MTTGQDAPSYMEAPAVLAGSEAERRTHELQSLQAHRVRRILLVASLYDSYTLSEGQHLTELLIGAYHSLALADPPRIDRVATRAEALGMLAEGPYDLVITMANAGVMPLQTFGRRARELAPHTPVVIVAYNTAELGDRVTLEAVDRAFLWRGDVRLLATIIKLAEDRRNAEPDADIAGVRTLILIEDGVGFYSAYLPLLFEEVTHQTDLLISEGLNTGQRLLRRRLRPRIVHATTYEEGWALYERFRETLLCMITDVRFPRNGALDPEAGLRLLRRVRAADPDLPLLLQSSDEAAAGPAADLGAGFVWKHSPTLLHDFHDFMLDRLGFGDFVFELPDGTEVAQASDIAEMMAALRTVPAESLSYHASRNDFSNWLMARTEFELAAALRKLRVSDFATVEAMRDFLCDTFAGVIESSRRGQVEDFSARRFGPRTRFVRIGHGSLGGKGRGLAFMHDLMSRGGLDDRAGVRFAVPRSAVIGTDVFDSFIAANDLDELGLRTSDDAEILRAFQAAQLPEAAQRDLSAYLESIEFPLAVRSSSLLEDSRHLPAAGVYPTHMLPNAGPLPLRLETLEQAIKHVFASTYFSMAKTYLEGSPGRVEDEKMAVVVQEIVGRRHGDYLYPDVSGVVRSLNVYPIGDMRPEDGVVIAALGLGRTVVEGEKAVRFSPAQPRKIPQFGTADEIMRHAQREFWALDLRRVPDLGAPEAAGNQVRLGLDVARRHGTLQSVASVYSPQNDAVYDGLGRDGVPLVTLAPVLKHGLFPLCQSLVELTELGCAGLAGPVELEFALTLGPERGQGELAFLQIRPLVVVAPEAELDIDSVSRERAVVGPCRALGAGVISGLADIVVVDLDRFDRGQTPAIADEIGAINDQLRAAGRPYILIGPGRWGSADRWLGIPVGWHQISGARAIVELGLDDAAVQPSDGAHFFHNVSSLGVGYFTAGGDGPHDAVDWMWLEAQPAANDLRWVRHIRLDDPVEAWIDGRSGRGAILKPSAG